MHIGEVRLPRVVGAGNFTLKAMNEDESKMNTMGDHVHSFQKKRLIDAAEKAETSLEAAGDKKAESRRKGRAWAMGINDPELFQWLSDAKYARITRGGGEGMRGDSWDRALDKIRNLGIADDEREDFANAAIDAYEEAEKQE